MPIQARRMKLPAQLPLWMLYAWSFFFIVNPFYVFGSGLPQPADWLMAFLFGSIVLLNVYPQGFNYLELLNRHRAFVIYVTLVNTIWFFFIDQSYEKRFPTFLHSFFYIFNFLALRAVLILSKSFRDKFLLYTTYALGISMIIQMVLSFVMESTESRNALFFNNPNQLGYYALLSGSAFVYTVRKTRVSTPFQMLVYFSFFYLTLLSSSKAALIGVVILISLAILNQGLFSIRQFIVLGLSIALGLYFVMQDDLGSQLFEYSVSQIEDIGQSKDDSYQGRGYDRILNDPEYMVLGAGEGGYYRFESLLSSGEIHSTFGTLVFCYGIIGFMLFFRFLFWILRRSSFFELLYLVPVFAYSVTHHGLRDTLFWVFLGLVFILNESKHPPVVARVSRFVKHKKNHTK
jgi:hypothetical protein